MAKERAGSQAFATVTKGSIPEFYKSRKHLVNSFRGFLHVSMRISIATGFKSNRSHAEDAPACHFLVINHKQKGFQMPITITGNLLSRFLRSLTSLLRPAAHRPPSTQVLLIVEGPNDIEFLRRISTILHRDDPTLPDLAEMETQHALVFVPSGGVDLSSAFRFASLGLAEFHLSGQDIVPA